MRRMVLELAAALLLGFLLINGAADLICQAHGVAMCRW